VAGADFSGNGRKTYRQVLDIFVADRLFKLVREPAASDQTGAADFHVEIADDAAHRQRARPGFERIELTGGIAAADQRTHRRADDNVRLDAMRDERAHHPDMGEAARRAAAENETDGRIIGINVGPVGVGHFAGNVCRTHRILAACVHVGRRVKDRGALPG
jgi:hypothetical protein